LKNNNLSGHESNAAENIIAVITSYFHLQSIFTWDLIRFLGEKVAVF